MNIKILSSALLLGCMMSSAAWATVNPNPLGTTVAADETTGEGTLAINTTTGAFTVTNSTGTFATHWKSTNTHPAVEVDCGVNNIDVANSDASGLVTNIGMKDSCDYVLSVSNGWLITGYSFDVTLVDSSKPVTMKVGGEKFAATTTARRVNVDGLSVNSLMAFRLIGGNYGVKLTNWTVSYKDDPASKPDPDLRETKVFTTTATSTPYRIPAIGKAGNGALVAVADLRPSHADIGHGRVDLRLRRSTDNGLTWGAEMAPENFAGDGNITSWRHDKAAYGDPCIVGDRESSRMMILSCSGFPGFFDPTDNHQGLARWYSDDNGETWTGPDYIDDEYIYKPFDEAGHHINSFFVGSGKIHQSHFIKKDKYYRLYCAGSSQQGGGNTENWVLYSDDFGESWDFLGGASVTPVPGGDEPKVEELPNGNVIISSRNVSGRRYNIYTFTSDDGISGHWGEVALSSTANNGLQANNGCNGEIEIVPVVRKADGKKTFIALQSLPIVNRTNVSIYYKDLTDPETYSSPENFAKNWDGRYQVSNTTSAYSTWCLQDDHALGFLYEENSQNDGYDIVYKRLEIGTITKGKYEYDTSYEYQLKNIDFAKAARVKKLDKLITEANAAMASNNAYVLGDALVKTVSQLSCPFKYSGTTTSDCAELDALLDNNPKTFYHTDYSAGNVTPGKHYLDVTSVSGTAFEKMIQASVTRRIDGVADHPSEFTIAGSNDDVNFTQIAIVPVSNATAGAVGTANFTIPDGDSYTRLRFYVTKTPLMRGYWHMAEFQLYPESLDPNCKNAINPAACDAMREAVDKASALTEVSDDDVTALSTAYEKYLEAMNAITAISSVRPETACPDAIYDLQGRRVNIATKGVYIINGKKVVR